jgi:hypothetical protein
VRTCLELAEATFMTLMPRNPKLSDAKTGTEIDEQDICPFHHDGLA